MKKSRFSAVLRSIGLNGAAQVAVLLLFIGVITAASGENSLYDRELALSPTMTSPVQEMGIVTQTITHSPTATKTLTITATTLPTKSPTDDFTMTPTIITKTPTLTATAEATQYSPTAETCGPPPNWIQYTVQSGDNLYRISLKFSTTIAALQSANCMGTSTVVVVGETIWVPNTPTTTPQPSETPGSSDHYDHSK